MSTLGGLHEYIGQGFPRPFTHEGFVPPSIWGQVHGEKLLMGDS